MPLPDSQSLCGFPFLHSCPTGEVPSREEGLRQRAQPQRVGLTARAQDEWNGTHEPSCQGLSQKMTYCNRAALTQNSAYKHNCLLMLQKYFKIVESLN